jgi:hypothetical protein
MAEKLPPPVRVPSGRPRAVRAAHLAWSRGPLDEQYARRVVSCVAAFMRLGGGDPGKALILAAREIVRLRHESAFEKGMRP